MSKKSIILFLISILIPLVILALCITNQFISGVLLIPLTIIYGILISVIIYFPEFKNCLYKYIITVLVIFIAISIISYKPTNNYYLSSYITEVCVLYLGIVIGFMLAKKEVSKVFLVLSPMLLLLRLPTIISVIDNVNTLYISFPDIKYYQFLLDGLIGFGLGISVIHAKQYHFNKIIYLIYAILLIALALFNDVCLHALGTQIFVMSGIYIGKFLFNNKYKIFEMMNSE